MKNIKRFRSIGDFNEYVENNIIGTKNDFIDRGSEGSIYITKKGEILKDMRSHARRFISENDIIMSDDIKLDSFIFPNELYIINGLIVGYKTKLFRGDIFINNRVNAYKDKTIDVTALVNARKRFIEDIKIITKKGYNLFDLSSNILFNNKELCAIDTLDYNRENVSLERNISYLDYGLIQRLYDHGLYNGYDNDFEKVITKIKKR